MTVDIRAESDNSSWTECLCGLFLRNHQGDVCYQQGVFNIQGKGSFGRPERICRMNIGSNFQFFSGKKVPYDDGETEFLISVSDDMSEDTAHDMELSYITYVSEYGNLMISSFMRTQVFGNLEQVASRAVFNEGYYICTMKEAFTRYPCIVDCGPHIPVPLQKLLRKVEPRGEEGMR
jgi:hypothetical protein